jgi:outer membrane lipoprotein carrier protein
MLIHRRPLFAFAAIFIATNPVNASTSELKDLENFIQGSKSLRADFTQTTTKPNGQKARPLTGSVELQRPGAFRFHYKLPFEQVIASDGQSLWVHDVDLNQLTVRKVAGLAAFAPALLVTSAANVAALQRHYDFAAIQAPAGTPADLRWLRATPKQNTAGDAAGDAGLAGPVARLDMAFKGESGSSVLAELVLVDASGQRTALAFTKLEQGVRFAPQHFQFKPPPGAQVLKQ